MPLQALMHERLGGSSGGSASSKSGKTLVLVAGEAVAAAEWQISWELPPGSSSPAALAAAVSHRLRINPSSGDAAVAAAAALRRQVWLPPPLAASLTVVLTAESGSLSLLAPVPLPLLHGHGTAAEQQRPGRAQRQLAWDSSAPPTALLDTVAVLHLGGLKAALHSYPSPEGTSLLTGDLQAQMALCLPDSSSAVAPAGTLLAAAAPGSAVVQPFLLDCAVEYSTCSDGYHLRQQLAALEQLGQQQQQQQAAEGGSPGSGSGTSQGPALQQLPFWQAQAAHQPAELALLAVRSPPTNRGLAVALSAQHQPVVVNASEALLAEARHLMAALSADPSADSSSSGRPPAASAAPLLLINHSGVALRVRQEGAPAHGQLLLQDGQQQSLLWPAPPPLVPGAVRRLQLAPAAAAEGDESSWSAPVDVSAEQCSVYPAKAKSRIPASGPCLAAARLCTFPWFGSLNWLVSASTPLQVMASGGHPILLPTPGRSSSSAGRSLAAQVRPSSSGSGWEVVLRPGMRVVNHLSSPVHFCLTRDGWEGSDDGSAAAAPAQQRSPQRRRREQHTPVAISSGGSTDLRLPADGAMLRLFLGGGTIGSPGAGWSQALSLPQQRQQPALMVLHSSPAAAATATAAGLDTPPEAAGQPPLGSVLAQLLPPDASGQAALHFWPPLLLHNSTQCALRLLLPAGGPQLPGADPAQQQVQEVVLAPGSSRQLAVSLQGGPVGSLLALSPTATEGTSPAAPAAAAGSGSRGMAIVVPPLIAESAEQQWFGASGPQAVHSPRGKPPPAVYIAPPGQSTSLRLPLLLPAAQGSAANAKAAAAAAIAATHGNASTGGKEIAASGDSVSGPAAAADCVLVTQHHADGLPCMQLSLLPAMVVHNCLPVPILFQVRGGSWLCLPPVCIALLADALLLAGWSLYLPIVLLLNLCRTTQCSTIAATAASCAGAWGSSCGGACRAVTAAGRCRQWAGG